MTAHTSQRRQVVYATLDEFLTDVRGLVGGHVTTVGNWTLAQILEHLARAIDSSIDGFSFQANWLVRKLVAPLLKNRLLTGRMQPGYNLRSRAASYLPAPDCELDSALAHLEQATARLDTTPPTASHPFLGRLSEREWLALHLRHAELHMSFVVPSEGQAAAEPTT